MDRQAALVELVALTDGRHRLTLEGFASVDAGEGAEQEAVEAWIDSLGADQPLPMPK